MFKRKKFLTKLKDYGSEWDTERYKYVQITEDGRLLPSNNLDIGEINKQLGQINKSSIVVQFFFWSHLGENYDQKFGSND